MHVSDDAGSMVHLSARPYLPPWRGGTLMWRITSMRAGLLLCFGLALAGAETMKVQLVTIDCENWPVDNVSNGFGLDNADGLGQCQWWVWADGSGVLRVRDDNAHSGTRCLYNDSEKWGFGMNLLTDPHVESNSTYEVHVWAKAVDPSKPMKLWSNFPIEGGGGALAQSNIGGTFPEVTSTEYTKVVFTHHVGQVDGRFYVMQLEAINDDFNYGAGYVDDIAVYRIEEKAPIPPSIHRLTPDLIVKAGATAQLWVHAVGPIPLSYQWYRNGEQIDGATSSSYAIDNVALEDNGALFTVKVSNESGEVTSEEALLTVTESGGPEVPLVDEPVAVDGTLDPAYTAAVTVPIAKAWGAYGTEPTDASDLHAEAHLLWDTENLYVCAQVTDDAIVSGGTDYSKRDAVELFVDIGNDKSRSFGASDFLYHFACDATSAEEVKHSATTDVQMASSRISDGYAVEAAIPWTTLGLSAAPTAGTVMGLELAARDVETSGEDAQTYLVWKGRAEATRSPSLWGTAQLAGSATKAGGQPSSSC
ncbi:MAG: hypothetical protein GF331_05600 [Chitinivibrionales bacterium]|nr:hypothetical protein [Chitinivibrionales bacterium]